ncbi:TIM barrel protein [uncultured Vagococcus sp.]|uniref:sugar phosphate isomerase/epimerase family protein n=1 Tax=uncultured Vagococcus sp. TaxID=189676 RepID=UPI0028D19AE1|nr:TIM barrel protein [uncultured Vagococcus sp.]
MTFRQKIAAQMYSVRKEFEADPEATLNELKRIGFTAIQVDGMRGHSVEKISQLVKKYDFEIAGMHIKHDRFMTNLDGIIEECYAFGCKTIYDKYIDDEEQHTEGYRQTKAKLIEAVAKLAPLGFRIGVHNPEYDYNNQIDGRNVLDYLTDPVNGYGVYSEPDTYWMTIAGENPLESFKKYSGRAPVVHLKDYRSGFELADIKQNLAEVGEGEVDIEGIVRWGEANKVEYYCVEQDYSRIGIFKSLEIGFNNLLEMGERIQMETSH